MRRFHRERGATLFQKLDPRLLLALLFSVSIFTLSAPLLAKDKSGKGRHPNATPIESPGDQSLSNIPLPVGHEAKGLVLPDFDGQGRLRGKLEAGTARRIDENHMSFDDLKITTYTPQKQTDLEVDMHKSVLDLKTRVLSSKERTTVKRADFDIVGDAVEFDTVSHTGRLIGNVKMVISSKSRLMERGNND